MAALRWSHALMVCRRRGRTHYAELRAAHTDPSPVALRCCHRVVEARSGGEVVERGLRQLLYCRTTSNPSPRPLHAHWGGRERRVGDVEEGSGKWWWRWCGEVGRGHDGGVQGLRVGGGKLRVVGEVNGCGWVV